MEITKSPEILKVLNLKLTDKNGFETILEDISFTVNRGDRVGIMGP